MLWKEDANARLSLLVVWIFKMSNFRTGLSLFVLALGALVTIGHF